MRSEEEERGGGARRRNEEEKEENGGGPLAPSRGWRAPASRPQRHDGLGRVRIRSLGPKSGRARPRAEEPRRRAARSGC